MNPAASSPFSRYFTWLCADNVTMCKLTLSHTALLSRFQARCTSSFQLYNQQSWLLGGGEPGGEPAISLTSLHVSLVQWTTRLLPVMRDPGSNPQGYLCETRILLLASMLFFSFYPPPTSMQNIILYNPVVLILGERKSGKNKMRKYVKEKRKKRKVNGKFELEG